MTSLPSLFVSHGSPAIALHPDATCAAWRACGRALGRPRGVVVATAHWTTERPVVGAALRPETIHDFHGFPRPLYDIRYPTIGSPALAEEVRAALCAAGIVTAVDAGRGLDHGVWVPLREMFPAGDVPVVPLAIQPERDPAHHHALGAALAGLARDNVLVVGSGSLTHNLRAWMQARGRPGVPPWVAEFAEWFATHAEAGDVPSLLDYRRRAPHAVDNHPTDEHLLPFYVALGAGGGQAAAARTAPVYRAVSDAVLAMDVYASGEPAALAALARQVRDGAAAGQV